MNQQDTPLPGEQPSQPTEKHAAPVLNYGTRKVMPMSQKALLLSVAGLAVGAVVLAGVRYAVVVTRPPLAGQIVAPGTQWGPATLPSDGDADG